MRIALALPLLPLLATFAPIGLYRPHQVPDAPWVQWTPLDARETQGCDFGGLSFIGGWALTSNHPEFGGLSALHVGSRDITAVSDTGFIMRFAVRDRGKVPLAVHAATRPTSSKRLRDSESLAISGGQAWIGFEDSNMVRRYRLPGWSIDREAESPAMRDWGSKSGPETLVALADGRFLIVPEGKGEALLFPGDPTKGGTPVPIRYERIEGFRPTDAAQLSDGRIIILNRRFSLFDGLDGFTVIVTVAQLPEARPGATIKGQEIARFARPCLDDNHEGISVTHDNGRDTVWIASDDNFGPLQRSLILKFALKPGR